MSKCIGGVCVSGYFNMLATATDLRLTALNLSLFLFSSIYLWRHHHFFSWGKTAKNTSHSLAAFSLNYVQFLQGGKKRRSTTSSVFGPISESLMSGESQDISGSVEQKESISRRWKRNIYQAVTVREGTMLTKTGAAYGPSILGVGWGGADNKSDS